MDYKEIICACCNRPILKDDISIKINKDIIHKYCEQRYNEDYIEK